MDEHETSHEGKRRNNCHNNPDKATSEDGLAEKSEDKKACGGEYGRDDLSPVYWSPVGDRDGCVMGELFGEGGWVKTARKIVLGGICPSVCGFPGTFDSRINRYDWGGHEV